MSARSLALYRAGLSENRVLLGVLTTLSLIGAILALATPIGNNGYWTNVAAAPPFALLLVLVAEVPSTVRASLTRCAIHEAVIKQSSSFLLELLNNENGRIHRTTAESTALYSTVRRVVVEMTNATRMLRREFASLRTYDAEAAIDSFGGFFYGWRDAILAEQDADEVLLGTALKEFLLVIGVSAPRHAPFPT